MVNERVKEVLQLRVEKDPELKKALELYKRDGEWYAEMWCIMSPNMIPHLATLRHTRKECLEMVDAIPRLKKLRGYLLHPTPHQKFTRLKNRGYSLQRVLVSVVLDPIKKRVPWRVITEEDIRTALNAYKKPEVPHNGSVAAVQKRKSLLRSVDNTEETGDS